MRLFSRIEWIILQTSKSWGAAAKRYASAIRVSSPFFFLGNTATTDESAPKIPTASFFFLTCKDPFALFSMHGLSAVRDENLRLNWPDKGGNMALLAQCPTCKRREQAQTRPLWQIGFAIPKKWRLWSRVDGGGPHCLDRLMGGMRSESIVKLSMKHQAASANG